MAGYSPIKASLIIELRGGKLIRNEHPHKLNYKVIVKNKKNKPIVIRQGTVKHYFSHPSICTKRIDITLDAWNAITSDENVQVKNWKNLTKNQRFELYCRDLCHDYNGIGYSYEFYF